MYILGINSAYHEPAACLLRDGEIVAAVEEERFNRFRHGKPANLANPQELPIASIRYCLDVAGIQARDIDRIGYSFVPEDRFSHNVGLSEETMPGIAGSLEAETRFRDLLLSVPATLSRMLEEDVSDRFDWIPHHSCHAASAFWASPFEEAAVLSIDGIGEATTTWFGQASGNRIDAVKQLVYPNSLGLLWTKMSRFLGFGEYGQWKVMGLAAYGNPKTKYAALRSFVNFDHDGNFEIDPAVLQLRVNSFTEFAKLFGPAREPEDEIEDSHRDTAAALQQLTTECLLSFASYLHRTTGMRKLCYAGGVALNCVANQALIEKGPFEEVFIQPAANDAGTALGACYYLWNQELGKARGPAMEHVYLGPEFSKQDVHDALNEVQAVSSKPLDSIELASEAAQLIAAGEIVAWFDGRMELGPRALGNRSILADPRRADMVHELNDKVKHREFFRPFAASVLAEKVDEWFDLSARGRSPADEYMLCTRRVHADKLGMIPAVTHVDGTCRIQIVDSKTNPNYHRLLTEFEKVTGIPMLLNTSFNDREPIICSPADAVNTCLRAGIRHLAMGGQLATSGASKTTQKTGGPLINHDPQEDDEFMRLHVMTPFLSR